MNDMIKARGLRKSYGDVEALAGLDLTVPEGAVLGLLGPNGAGKTTAVRIIATLLQPNDGAVEVAGVDVLADPHAARERLGLSGQYAAVDEYLTGYENLEMVGRLYGMTKGQAADRARELLDRFSLSDAGDRPSRTYSGGMRRRLDLAGALVAEPPVLILDEPTTGLDPRSRVGMWSVIRELVSSGTTVLLTTQYLEEADQLADEIVVIDRGLAIAQGTADELKSQTGGRRIEVVLVDAADRAEAARLLAMVGIDEIQVDDAGRTLTVPVAHGPRELSDVLLSLEKADIAVHDIGLRRPTLDDVFLTLTGHAADEAADAVDDEVEVA